MEPTERYSLHTSATEGFITTPGFGEPYKANQFRKEAYYDYYIYPPKNIFSMAVNLSLVFEMTMDTKETTGGDDYVRIYALGKYKDQKLYSKNHNLMNLEFIHIIQNHLFKGLQILFFQLKTQESN